MRLARTSLGLALAAALVALAAGCGRDQPTTPVACFEGSGAYE
jgi:hypothetical protein